MINRVGTVNDMLIQNRRVMFASSGSLSSASLRAAPAPYRRSGKIPVQAHNLRMHGTCVGGLVSGESGAATSSAIPHFGHRPGPISRTSGCIGQVYSLLPPPEVASAKAGRVDFPGLRWRGIYFDGPALVSLVAGTQSLVVPSTKC